MNRQSEASTRILDRAKALLRATEEPPAARSRSGQETVDFGDLRRLVPYCTAWGATRGSVIGRHYVESFLRRHAAESSGRYLEFGDPRYRCFFSSDNMVSYDILDLEPGETVTIVGDIQGLPDVRDGSFDCIVCTEVLEHVANPFKAINEIQRILAPRGTLLLTVPHINKIHKIPRDFWRFTEDSLSLLLSSFSDVNISFGGNLLVTLAFSLGLAVEDLTSQELEYRDPEYPVIFTVKAVK